MKKREFIKTTSVIGMGALIAPLSSCGSKGESAKTVPITSSTTFSLPDLPYAHDALEPFIDVQTMQIHHGKHHAGYVRKLNAALEASESEATSVADICRNITDDEASLGLRNNGGGHFNHSMFWKVMTPGGGLAPEGALLEAINGSFDGMENFESAFAAAAGTRFGSGWAWLSKGADGKLFVSSTPNQDNPLMRNVVEKAGQPILGIDVWEHAYYLKYQNKRKEYISNFMRIINWEQVAKNLVNLG